MFVELGTFINEKEVYNQKMAELKNTIQNPEELARVLEEEKKRFKGITRKYLPTALSVIKNTFKCDYSLYKVGRDVDANFNTIETNVNKTQTEIANEMTQFVQQANSMGLTAEQANKLNLSISIIMSYIDDNAVDEDQNKTFYLNHSKVVASSLDLPITKKVDEPVVTTSVQHNPYANQPLNLNNSINNNSQTSQSNNGMLVEPFANIYSGSQPQTNTMYQSQPATQMMAASGYQTNINTGYSMPNMNNQAQFQQPINMQQQNIRSTVNLGQQQYSDSMMNAGAAVVMPNTPVLLSDDEVVMTEKNCVLAQLISTILIPIMVVISASILYFIFKLDFVTKLMSEMPTSLNRIAICILIGTLCLICSGPIINVAKKRTGYLERFMIVPLLLSLPISSFLIELLSKVGNIDISINTALDLAIILILSIIIYFPFGLLLLIRAFTNSNNKQLSSPVWNIWEKLGMLVVIYIIIIPAISMILLLFEVNFINDILKVIYFTNNPSISEHFGTVLFFVNIALSILIMITRSITKKRVGNVS